MADNPIKYSDLVVPDESITNLIKQLNDLAETYKKTQKEIVDEAIGVKMAMQGVSGATEEGRRATRKASEDADRLAKAQKNLNFAQSENAKKLQILRDATREANEITKLQIKLNNSAEGSYNRLSAQYSLNKIRLNKMSDEYRHNTEEGRKLEKETKAIYEQMKKLQEATGKHQLNVGNYPELTQAISSYGEKLKETFKLNNVFGESLLALGKGGEESKAVFTAMGDGAKSLGKTLMGLMSNPVFLAIAGIAAGGMAFKWWYDYNSGLVEASRLTKQFTGKAGDDMKAFRNEILVVADTFNKDFKEILQAVDQLSANFGISADEALEKVRKGFLAGADANGQFLENLQQAPELIKAGVKDADEFVAVLAQAKSGLFQDPEALQQAISMRTEAEGITLAFERIADPSLLEELKAATHGTVSELELMKAAVQFSNFKLPLDQLGTYLAYAQQKAKDTGQSVDYLVNSIVLGLGRGSVKILDNLGLSAAAIKDRMKQTGDMTTAVASLIQEDMAAAGEYVETAGDRAARATANRQNQILELAKTMDTSLDDVIEKNGELARIQEEQMQAQGELQEALSALFDQTGGSFESLSANVKLFTTRTLTALIQKVVQLINYFVDFYNKSKIFRALIQGMVANFKITMNAIGNIFGLLMDNIVGAGKMLKGIFTLDWKSFKEGAKQYAMALPKLIKATFKDANKAVVEGMNNMQKQAKPLTVKLQAETDKKQLADEQKKAQDELQKTKDELQKTKDELQNGTVGTGKGGKTHLEAQYKKQLDSKRKLEDAILANEADSWAKREQQIRYQYDRQIEDLKHQAEKEKTIRQTLNETVVELAKQRNAKLAELERERTQSELNYEKESISVRLQATQEGTEEEYELKREAIENERKLAILANAKKPESEQQALTDIMAMYDKKLRAVDDSYMQMQLKLFDQSQELAQSEFDLLTNSEERKTRFKLEQEKARLKKVLELNMTAGTKLSDTEVQTIKNTITRIDNEISQSKGKEQSQDLYGLFGLNLSSDQKQAIDQSVGYAMDALNTYMQAYTAAADAKVELANKEVDNAQRVLEAELTARANGYASDVTYAQKQLDLKKKEQEKALKEQRKAQREQQAIESLQQISSLVTATAGIWKTFHNPAIAIPAIAVMWGSFIAAKVKAAQLAKESYGEGTVELLQGGSHQSGNDVDLGHKADGTQRRAEGGEFFAVINKRNSRRFRRYIPDVIKSLNNGTFTQKYMSAYNTDGVTLNVQSQSPDLTELAKNVREIKEQNERRTYIDADGNLVIQNRNVQRKIRR